MKTLSEFAREIAHFDRLIKPIADAPIDINDPEWETKLQNAQHPLDQAGIREPVQNLLSEVLTSYVDGNESEREKMRELFHQYDSFAWAATPREPIHSRSGLRAHLILLSVQDQGKDPRDVIVALDDLAAKARAQQIDIKPLLTEVANISSHRNRYGMGSMRDLLLACRERQR